MLLAKPARALLSCADLPEMVPGDDSTLYVYLGAISAPKYTFKVLCPVNFQLQVQAIRDEAGEEVRAHRPLSGTTNKPTASDLGSKGPDFEH
jgi:hypothetical protein